MLVTMLLASAFAQDGSVFVDPTSEDAAEKPEAHLSAELGGAVTSGNTEFWTLSATGSGSYKWKKNKFAFGLGALTGRGRVDANGDGTISDAERDAKLVETARKFTGDLRYDRFFGEKNSLYLLAGAFHDPFSGYQLRSHEQVGYSRLLAKTDALELTTELGVDYAQEFYNSGIDPSYQGIVAGKVLVGGSYTFNEAVSLSEQVELYENVVDPADLRLLNTAAITAKVGKPLSLKVGHTLIFDNVPVEGFRKLDHTLTLTLVATLL